VLLTAGLAGIHQPSPHNGRDLDDLAVPGLAEEPRVLQIRAAATLVGQQAWIRVTLPSGRDAGEPIGGLDMICRWTSVAHDDLEMAVLREALAVNNRA
jgi:hypothetical protein